MAGLYLHVPFCKQACHYCDFHFSTRPEGRQELIQALATELVLQKEYLQGAVLNTIYFGGGTPSLLHRQELESILEPIGRTYSIAPDAEVTLEANPDDLTDEKLAQLKSLGIHRLSVGIQSFDDPVLKFLNRAHDAKEATRCLAVARSQGFSNISIDLIYAIPGQTLTEWRKNIEKALQLDPEHISAYALTLEKKTVFGQWHAKGKLQPLPEEMAAQQFELLMDMLQTAGYEHYEISNFCRPGFHSRHNTSYWQQVHYLGVGPSAHSYDGTSRQFNISNNALYCKAIESNQVPYEREVLTRENRINEYLFTTLRTSLGCDLNKIKVNFQFDAARENEIYLATLQEKKLATLENNRLILTRAGKLLADQIAADLFVHPGND
jgi:oxygen-independent coproporphyrinogen III oxidase